MKTERGLRAELWAHCWASVASASDCKGHKVATSWADHMLEALDERFPELKEAAKAEE